MLGSGVEKWWLRVALTRARNPQLPAPNPPTQPPSFAFCSLPSSTDLFEPPTAPWQRLVRLNQRHYFLRCVSQIGAEIKRA